MEAGIKTKEKSYMLVIPRHEEELSNVQLVMDRIRNSPYFTVKNMCLGEDGCPLNEIEYKGEDYSFSFYPEHFRIPQMFRVQHFFKDVDIEEIDKRNTGLLIVMEFSDKSLESYHLQLRVINTLFPDIVGVLDYSAEKILSGAWVELAAKSDTLPAPRYLFSIQEVFASKEDIWLHTHGLNRCGLMELEVLGSTEEAAEDHCNVIESVATRLIEEPDLFDDERAIYAAKFCNNQPLMVTWVPWQQAMETMKEGQIGGPSEREDEAGHNGYTGSLFVYVSPKDMEENHYSHLSIYDELLKQNPMFMFSNEETARMKSLAIERVEYMKKAFAGEAKLVLVKVGLVIDEEYQTEKNKYEHIWFELKSVEEDHFTAELTQEPYMVSGIHEGDMRTCSYDEITDWLIFTEKRRISPDEVYLMN